MYLSWDEQTIVDFNDETIEKMYGGGFVFTRLGKGIINQTRSLRIDLNKFELSSENKRVLKKTEDLILSVSTIPYAEYDWSIHKMGKEFYAAKFGEKTPALNRPAGPGLVFSAQKIKELITDKDKSNFNRLFVYSFGSVIPTETEGSLIHSLMDSSTPLRSAQNDKNAPIGYCITLETKNILHYCYPFYQLLPTPDSILPNLGMGMMLKAIVWAKENNKKFIYLGSFQRPTDIYKLQFAGLEWFDKTNWQNDLEKLKKIYV